MLLLRIQGCQAEPAWHPILALPHVHPADLWGDGDCFPCFPHWHFPETGLWEVEQQLKKVDNRQSHSALLEKPPKRYARVIVMLGTYDMTTSHVCDIVWQSWSDLGLFKGKDDYKK